MIVSFLVSTRETVGIGSPDGGLAGSAVLCRRVNIIRQWQAGRAGYVRTCITTIRVEVGGLLLSSETEA